MKRKLSERSYANITELEEAVNVAWADIKITTINKLIESFAARCLAVLEANGECIKDLLHKHKLEPYSEERCANYIDPYFGEDSKPLVLHKYSGDKRKRIPNELQKKFSPLELNDVLGRKLLDLFVSKEGKCGLIECALGEQRAFAISRIDFVSLGLYQRRRRLKPSETSSEVTLLSCGRDTRLRQRRRGRQRRQR